MRPSIRIFILAFAIISSTLAAASIKDFRRGFFTLHQIEEGFHEVDLFDKAPSDGIIPLAYVYLPSDNSDNQYRANIMSKTSDSTGIQMYRYDYDQAKFMKYFTYSEAGRDFSTAYYCTALTFLTTLDNFNTGNESSGLLLVSTREVDGQPRTEYTYKPNLDNSPSVLVTANVTKDFQPFVLDLAGDYSNGIIYMTADPPVRVYQKLDHGSPVDLSHYLKHAYDEKVLEMLRKLPISNPHFSAFVDFNGDCWPDLLLTSFNATAKKLYLEFWISLPNSEYELMDYIEIPTQHPSMISQFIIADFERKGSNDIIYYDNNKHGFFIIRNRHRAEKKRSLTSVELCNPNPEGLTLDKPEELTGYDWKSQHDNIYKDPESGVMRLSIGDMDQNGVKDLLFVTEDGKVRIYAVVNKKEGVRLEKYNNAPEFDEIKNAIGASFFDLDDTGSHSILVETERHELKGYLRVHAQGNYFLKALAFQKSSIGQPRVGICYQYIITDIDGSEILYAGHQITSNAHRALQFPFMLTGLGRCQNYIEQLTFGRYPLSDNQVYTPVIPNSQLIITKTTSGDWLIELLVNPSSGLLMIFFVFWGILLVVSIVAFILHMREIKEDEKERKRGFIILA